MKSVFATGGPNGLPVTKGGWLLLIGASGLVVYLLYRAGKRAITAVANVNQGTPYQGAGVVGTLGNLTNQASGGTLASLGSWLGGKAYDFVNGSYDPNAVPADRNTPSTNPGVVSNPVSPSPAVLQYSYKQATVDNSSLLGTSTLFTPGDGSSGAYAESGTSGTAAGPTTDYYDFGVGDTTSWN